VVRVKFRGVGSGVLALWLVGAPAGQAEVASGTYLAARAAGISADFRQAAVWFDSAIAEEPDNPAMIEQGLIAHIGMGEMDRARELADAMRATGHQSQIANMVTLARAAREDDWPRILAELDAGRGIGPLLDGLMRAWALIGAGETSAALAAFDEVTAMQGLRAFGLYHKALALASVGDFEGADAILGMSGDDGFQRTGRSVLAHVEVLSQLGRNDQALALLVEIYGDDPEPLVVTLRTRLAAGEPVPYDFVKTPNQGFAEVFLSVAGSIRGQVDESVVLTNARIALDIDPDLTDARLMVAETLDRLEQYDLAAATYAGVPPEDPQFVAAELGRAEVLRRSDEVDSAIAGLRALSESHPGLVVVEARLGDMLRRSGDMAAANAAYTRALGLSSGDDPALWLLYYTRGITAHQLDDWPAAEADFRKALDLRPGHPQVLNYLGYSLVERHEKLDEALAMIEQAVAGEPENGAIVDSLGWVLFRLGRHSEAVVHLERAASLEPVDPVINDHLGDAYWAVGRLREADFQWKRALSFGPEEEEAARIRRKLEVGLDAVMAEEGRDPIRAVDGGG
jgi:tetratricopeptide (TPR) repeat protein